MVYSFQAGWNVPICVIYLYNTYIHDVIGDVERKKEREKERKTPEANGKIKTRVASGGIRTTTLCTPDVLVYTCTY